MQELEYAETVIASACTKSLAKELKWRTNTRSITAELTGISISIDFVDDGPDSAIWQYVMIKHPVGEGWTMVSNPAGPTAHLAKNLASGPTLDHVNAIFNLELLEPRQKSFATAIAALRNS